MVDRLSPVQNAVWVGFAKLEPVRNNHIEIKIVSKRVIIFNSACVSQFNL